VKDELPLDATAGELYRPAMKVTDPEEARAYFERLVERRMRAEGCDRARAELVERQNLWSFAGFYADHTPERLRRLFTAPHPLFGDRRPTEAEARATGRGEAVREPG